MNHLHPDAHKWLLAVLAEPFNATKHVHSHQDEVYKIETARANYYLKIAKTLTAERDNLKKLVPLLPVPHVIAFQTLNERYDCLLISELPGKNLVELIGEWADDEIVSTFAQAIARLHQIDATNVFPGASANDVLLHGDMALPNIIISPQNDIGYIDFGQLSFGSPELDLVDGIWSLQRNLGPAYGKVFLQEYGPVTMTPKIQEALAFRYVGGQN